MDCFHCLIDVSVSFQAGQFYEYKAGSPLGGKMSRRKSFRQSDWLIELSPRKNVEPRIVGICSTFRGSTFFRLVEIRPNVEFKDKSGSPGFV